MVKEQAPEKAICLDCQGEFELIHWAHLSIHGYRNQLEYRQTHDLNPDTPLHSQHYHQMIRDRALLAENIASSREKGIVWQEKRRNLIEFLAEKGLFVSQTASIMTNIPKSTLQSAMQKGRLPYGLVCLRVPINRGFGNGGLAKIIATADLYHFVKNHKPRSIG